MEDPGVQRENSSKKVFDACHTDFNVSDSDFKLPEEITAKCQAKKNEIQEEEEEEEEFDEEEEEEEEEEMEEKASIPLTGLNPCCKPPPAPEELRYQGLPPDDEASQQFRTEYPVGFSLKKECIPKPQGKWKTVDNYKTQPVAKFSPVSSKIRLQNKVENEKIAEEKKPKAPICQKTSRDPPPIVSVNDEVVVSYLADNNIQMMFEYFMSLCILHSPEDPFQFISELTDKLIKGRDSDEAFQAIPRLLTGIHLESMFRLYDRVGSGFISYTQYKNAMGSIGLLKFNQLPEGQLADEITKETFMTEAKKAVDDLLRSFLSKSKKTEPKCT